LDPSFLFSPYFYGSLQRFNFIQPSRQRLILLSKKQKTPAHLGVKLKNSAPLIKLNALNHLNRASVGDRVSSFFLLLAALEHKSVAARAVMSQEDQLDPDRGVF